MQLSLTEVSRIAGSGEAGPEVEKRRVRSEKNRTYTARNPVI